MKLAVIKTGGKQYVVEEGDVVTVEKLSASEGEVTLETLMTDDGKAISLKSGKATGTIESVGRAKKVEVVRYKQKSRYLKRRGHRQPFIKVKISKI